MYLILCGNHVTIIIYSLEQSKGTIGFFTTSLPTGPLTILILLMCFHATNYLGPILTGPSPLLSHFSFPLQSSVMIFKWCCQFLTTRIFSIRSNFILLDLLMNPVKIFLQLFIFFLKILLSCEDRLLWISSFHHVIYMHQKLWYKIWLNLMSCLLFTF